jgi:hypothetical protein
VPCALSTSVGTVHTSLMMTHDVECQGEVVEWWREEGKKLAETDEEEMIVYCELSPTVQ